MEGDKAVLSALLLLWTAAASAQVETSTGAARPRRDLPLDLTFIQDRGGDRRVELGYSLRWDFDDLQDMGPGLVRTLRDPASVWRGQSWDWDIRDRTGFLIYGVRVNPWKALFETDEPVVATGTGTAAGVGAPGGARRRFRPSVWPMIKDINDHIDEDIRRMALRESLRRMGPRASGKTVEDEKELVRDLLWWQREREVQGLSGAAEGLRYLVPQDQRRPGPDHIRISTASAPGRF
ncbi:MAG: hypothetical protein HY926_01145 [Elusimicrobia bacterium]|nr:hypothetical protein [Elusimicrobiota bacterium]